MTHDTSELVERIAPETKAWAWLTGVVESICDEAPEDIDYSADQMVDAYLAGRASALEQQSAEIARLRETGDALLTLVQLVREYLPPEGISKDEFINRVIHLLDNEEINPVIEELEGKK